MRGCLMGCGRHGRASFGSRDLASSLLACPANGISTAHLHDRPEGLHQKPEAHCSKSKPSALCAPHTSAMNLSSASTACGRGSLLSSFSRYILFIQSSSSLLSRRGHWQGMDICPDERLSLRLGRRTRTRRDRFAETSAAEGPPHLIARVRHPEARARVPSQNTRAHSAQKLCVVRSVCQR